MDIISYLKFDPLTVFYYEEEDVLIWKDFIEQETTAKVIPPHQCPPARQLSKIDCPQHPEIPPQHILKNHIFSVSTLNIYIVYIGNTRRAKRSITPLGCILFNDV